MSANLDPSHIAVVNTTISQYVKGAEDNTIRRRILLAHLRKNGKITYGNSGTSLTWQIEFSQPPMRQLGDAGEITFAEHVAYKQATLPWRGYVITDLLTEKQRLENRGAQALVNLYKSKTDNMIKSFNAGINAQFYVDGNATGNENAIHGFKSCLGYSAPASTDLIATPNDSYAGLTTNLATYGGTWSAARSSTETPQFPNATLAKDWPYGSGESEYDFCAPKILNSTSSNWGTGSTSWSDNCQRVISRANIWMRSTGGDGGAPILFLFGSDMFSGIRDYYEAKTRVIVPHKESEDLGFSDVFNIDGCGVGYDFDCPSSQGFGLKIAEIELACMYDNMFAVDGPEKFMRTNSYLTKLGFFGNMKLKPKHMAYIAALA